MCIVAIYSFTSRTLTVRFNDSDGVYRVSLYGRRVSTHLCPISEQKSQMIQQQLLLPTPAGLLRKAKYKTLKISTSPLFLRPKTTS